MSTNTLVIAMLKKTIKYIPLYCSTWKRIVKLIEKPDQASVIKGMRYLQKT